DALRIPEMISLCYIKIQKIQVTREYDLVLLGFFILLGLLSQPRFDVDRMNSWMTTIIYQMPRSKLNQH
ncbi:hypothetical protein, partial [Lentilactobacillus hilgardii]|uniref:hypothetical protein n=1 Tax=Lentilactobacillus hilgardii TaxID=1588 RepID=UPI0021C2F584